MPRDPFTDEPLNVKVGFDVNSIAEINEPEESVTLQAYYLFEIVFITKSVYLLFQMYFSLKFSIWLKWSDNRLEYQNLNEDHFQNIVSKEVAAELWKPVLILENYIGDKVGGQRLEYSPIFSDMMLVRNGEGVSAGLSILHEAKVYNSSKTEILLKSHQFLRFECQMDLLFFPFDDQKCHVKVKKLLSGY